MDGLGAVPLVASSLRQRRMRGARPRRLAAFFGALLLLGGEARAQSTAPDEPPTSPAPPASTNLDESEEEKPQSPSEPVRLPEVVVHGREDSLVGVADSGSQGTVGGDQLEERPLSRPGEVLETVPGLILTQHSGTGKANQFFLRGFNLDHGTDFATSIDGVPVNLPTHGHGQGWTDLNFLIPELVERVSYRKGVYYADVGDFSSAGAANIEYVRSLEQRLALVEGGSFGYWRGVLAASSPLASGDLLYAGEVVASDGPWDHPDDAYRLNGVLRYSRGDASRGWSISGMGYGGSWDATDQIAERALALPGFDRFDSLDTSDGGRSQKGLVYAEWHRSGERSTTRALAYGFYQNLDLFSNFTYFLSSPQGDQFEQTDQRWVGGGSTSYTRFDELAGRAVETTVGLQLRSDSIENGLFQTVRRHRADKLDYDGGVIPAETVDDDVWQLSVGPYLESRVQWTEWLRSVVGVRGDYYHFSVESNLDANSGVENDFLASPKLTLILGPWAATELYLQGGLGFQSNDGRGTTLRVDPTTGQPARPVDPLVRTYGAEIGVRTSRVSGLQTTLSLWWLDLDSEILFVGDAGTTEPTPPSRRYGVELANYWTPTEWLTVDLDVSLSRARFREDVTDTGTGANLGRHIPGSIESAIAAGVALHDWHGLLAGVRLRYFGSRPLTEDDSVRSDSTILVSAYLGYRFANWLTLRAEIFNLLDRDDSEIDYFYESRLSGEPAGVDDIHFHPVDPLSFRLSLAARF